MKFYITTHGEVVSTSEYFGKYEDLYDAKQAAFEQMSDGEELIGFDEDLDKSDYWEQDSRFDEYWSVNTDKADCCVTLRRTDDSIEGVSEGLYFWYGEGEDYETFYNSDGTEWDGEN